MSTTTIPSPTFTLAPTGSPRAAALRAEWTKLRTLRSVWMTMAISVVASVSLAALAASSNARDWKDMTAEERLAFDPVASRCSACCSERWCSGRSVCERCRRSTRPG